MNQLTDQNAEEKKVRHTSVNNFKKSLNLLNTPRVTVIPSGDCTPT